MLPATFKARSKSTDAKSTADKNRLLAKLLIAGSIFLLPMGNAFAAADLSTSSAAFVSADPARTNSYMDAGGVWNGLTEVSNVGDTFTLTIANTAGGSIALDSAFDLQDVIVTVAAGFNLASNALNINNVTGGACPDISVGTAQQTGTQITLNIGNNEDVRPGCTYELSFGMTTTNTVAGGSHPLSYSISYDDDGGNPQTIPVAQNIDVNTGALSVSKTTATVTAVATDVITYDVTVTSTGAGGLFDVQLNDVLSADLNGLTFNVPIPPPGSVLGNNYTFEYLAAGEVVNLTIDATVTPVSVCPVLENTANLSERRAIATDTAGPVAVQFDFQFTSGPLSNAISHAATSYCEFCGDGVVSITVQNPTNAQLTNISLLEDLQGSGLEYIPGTTTINAVPAANPGIAGLSNELLTWNLPDLAGSGNHVISFGVRSTNAEALNTAVRDVIATVDFDMSCLAATQSVDTGQFELPIRQPIPTVFKDGRNYDAGQTIGSAFTDPVYGSFNDDVIWQVNVANAGLANMEALLMNDSIDGNFSINFICPTEGDAEAIAIANGVGPGATSCIPFNSSYNVVDPFGNIADPDDVAATSNVSLYYVGRILNLNTDNVNTADISWGCAVDSPTGGSITAPASTGGVTPGVTILETGDLSTDVLPADLVITQTVTGSNPGQPLGSKGLMTITLENQTGGSIQGLTVATDLPAGYVMDNSYGPVNGQPFGQPTNVTTPIYGVYPGFIDTFTRDDLELITLDPLDDLNPTFTLTSTTFGADLPQQQDMLRHGDIISFTFGIVMIEAARFDLVADLDVAPENTADGTDPTNAVALTNTVVVNFDAVDSTGPQGQSENQPFGYNSNPEDLDVSISDQLFILTNNPGTPLDLNVLLTNNGGHDADDYTAYVAFGQAMTVQTIPAGCGVGPVANPPPHPHWNDPVAISALAFVYACDRGAIAPGVTETITFAVVKAAGAVADDLTFRADVVGEVTQFDGTALTFPTPPTIPDTTPNVAQLANNYSFDAIRSRVLGFNLVKSAWYCAEDGLLEPAPPADILSATPGAPNIPTLTGNLNSQIGEDCTYRIETGGWFGFVTPGFALIEVQNVTVTDDLPNNLGDGQGYIEFGGTPFNYTSTGGIQLNGPNGGAGTTPLDGTDIAWNFNTASGIAVADEFFRVDFKTRLLNNPVDLAYPVPGGYAPNLHGNLSTNIARSSFTAVFQSAPIGGVVQPLINIDVSDTLSNPAGYIVPPGYPAESQRRVDLTEVEPNLIVTKQVCNESLNGFGPGCNGGTFADSVNDGDTNDSYIYRVTLTNEVTAPVRSPAFNVIATDTLDSSDLMEVVDFSSDGLDNDGDLTIDEADEADLFASIPDNILGNGTEAVITVDETFNNLLLQVDSGDTITFYYRVDPDITIAPLQTLTNTVSMEYDSLEAAFGNQNAPQLVNSTTAPNDIGRARIYTTITQAANVIMLPLQANPKIVTALSNTPFVPLGDPHDVVVGEEVAYELLASLPVANLRDLKVRDALPPGVRCVEGDTVNLDAPPYDVAGFVPGGTFAATCGTDINGDFIIWNFGDQAVTQANPGLLFNFRVGFIARVENSALTFEGATLTNGGVPIDDEAACTSTGGGGVGICYVNDMANAVALDFAAVDLTVREPLIALTKSFAPVVNSDAADILTVTVTATNNGTAAAYNLQLLDDLAGTDLTYINDSMAGANAADDDGVAADSKLPIFTWDRATNPDYEILPTAVKTFTFQVRVDTPAQPLEILDNTIQAKWDSLPGQDVALPHLTIPAGIGPNGSATGLRNGAVPNVGPPGAPNDYETTAAASTSVLPLSMSKTDLNPAVVPTIGAHRNFEVVINLPEGTTENLVVDDALLFGGVSYALSRNASFDVSYTFVDIVSINGLPPAEAVFRGATAGPPTLPVDGDTGTITWDIGQVITAEEDDQVVNAVNPQIIINYFARPNNDAATNVGVTLQNSATVNYDNGETAATEILNDTTALQTVVEPVLTIGKAVSNITNPGVGPVGGDVLEYVITIDNTGNSTAFDSNIVDTLDANVLFDASFTPTALLDGIAVPAFVSAPSGTPAGPLIWGRGNTPVDNSLDIPVGPGQTLELTYRVVVQTGIEPNEVISNSVLVDWTSLDDADPSNAFERTGAGCPAIVAPNDYCSAPAVAIITADERNSIVKTVIEDTYVEPPLSTAFDSIVRVGDTVTYQLDVNIQEGTTASVNILDTVPAGMTFVDVVSINGASTAPYAPPVSGAGSNFSYAPIPAASVPTAGNTLALNWNLGTIANDAAGDPTTDSMIIIYRARVTENILPQINTLTLTNTADLTYIDGIGNPSPAGLNDTADIFVLQPIMDALSKTDRLARPSGITVVPATDVMEFNLQTCNTTGLAHAYGLLLTDTLPSQLNETTLVGPSNGALAPDVLINGVLASDGVDYVYTPPAARGGNMVFSFNTPIDPGICVDINFDMGFYTDFAANQSWSNTVDVNEYWSMPPANAQLYPAIGPVTFDMNNLGTTFPPPVKTMVTPAPALPEATIGDEVVYQIMVPATPAPAVMYDVTITDPLANSLVYVSASDIGPNGFVLTDNTVLPGNVNLVIPQILAGQQAIIELRARVDNTVLANAGNTFVNTATYTFANTPAGVPILGGSDTTASTLTVIEPVLALAKSVANVTQPGLPPDAGDILRYTVTLTASGGAAPGDLFSDAFDVSLDDSLSLGLLYNGNESVNGGNTINPPVIAGDGVTVPQSLSWSLAQANADIDVIEGSVVTVNYDVLVLDSVLADQSLGNSVDIQWNSRDGPDANERDGSGVPPLNDYFNLVSAVALQTTPDNNIITKTRLSDTFNPADNIVRIGDIVEYELRINMQEGTNPNFIVQDTLPEGLIFEQAVSINGQTIAPYPAVAPFTHAAIPAPVVLGDPVTGPTTVTWNAGDVINAGDNLANNDFVIIYRARVLNLALPQLPTNSPLANNVDFDYDIATGAAPTKTGNELLALQQPDLSITKISLPVGGSVIGAGDLVTYTVEITNNGDAPAYDTELLDTIPFGLRSPAITMVSMQLLSGTPLPGVLAPVYDPVTGTATWNFDTGVADAYNIPPGDVLQIVYQVQADAGLGAGLTMTNSAQVQFYYSFDNDAVPSIAAINGVREIYGPSNTAQVTLTTVSPNPLLKENPIDLDASIGETFTYRITVPETLQATALYDVQILDDLTASAADLRFDSVAWISGGTLPIVPVNIGTVTDNLVIADVTNGIDIAANDQVVIEITVTLRDSDPPNIAPLPFSNTASYTFNQVNGDNGTVSIGPGNTTPLMTVVEPDLTMDKRGPAGTVNFATPIPYTLVVENIGTAPAFDTTIVDQLPDVPDNAPLTGGTCDATPINYNARITTSADESTVIRALALNTDYTATYTAAPTCELVITTITDTARVEAGEKLIVSYETMLDVATQSGALLSNIAGATQWFSLDTAGAGATDEIREYAEVLTSGTPGFIDHEDVVTVTVEAAVLDIQKTVINVTTGQNPGTDATPGDVLRYSITISNSGLVDASAVTLSDAIPANASYIADTVTLNGLPVGQPDGGVSPLVAGIDVSSSDLPPPIPSNGTITVGETATVTFDVLLDPVISSGTVILNQAIADSPTTGPLPSDDPNVGGVADPTPTLITSAPAFLVQKISLDLTGDPATLLAGDTLRYTLTIENIGQENSINSLLSDQVPANTTYVANSTRLNAVVVADPAAGISPLAAGMLINAPQNTTAGILQANVGHVSTVTFDVVVSLSAVNGTIIFNQGFVSGQGNGSGVFPTQPSDDPGTPLADDPTLDVVGDFPLVDVVKTVAIINDIGTIGVVDQGEQLRYTITATNFGPIPATGVVLTDAIPVATNYLPNSVFLNTVAIGQPDGGISPLVAGIDISSSDQLPQPPTPGNGILSPGETATIVFDVLVDNTGLAPPGTIISNQGFVSSNELPTEPSDFDGIDSNGDQPTIVIVGNIQQLAITKAVFPVSGTATAGSELEYVVRVTNVGGIDATGIVITDNLDLPVGLQLNYVPGSGTLNGLTTGVAFADPVVTASYSLTYGDLPPGGVAELRFRAQIEPTLPIGTTITNIGEVTWSPLAQTASASADIDVGGMPGSVTLNGSIWHDTSFDQNSDPGEIAQQNWNVAVYQNSVLLNTVQTDTAGDFQITGLVPNNMPGGIGYELRFLAPGATATSATLGNASSIFTNGPHRITDIIGASGTNLLNLNLPIQPNGVVYEAVLRSLVAGVQLTMINQTRSNQVVPPGCFDDPNHQGQITSTQGYYKFDLNFGDPARCAQGDEYEIQVQPPTGFVGTTSLTIPPVNPVTGAAQDVPNCPGTAADRIGTTGQHCENSTSPAQPNASIPPRTSGTDYYLKFLFDANPETDQIYNNHIPVDQSLAVAVGLSKIAAITTASRGQLVPYTITFNNTLDVPFFDLGIVDIFPAGFKYMSDSASLDGVASEPLVDGRTLTWTGIKLDPNETRSITLLLVVGSAAGEGEYVNIAQAINSLNNDPTSGIATATVRVVPDPTFDCTDVIGKVFDDRDHDGYQGENEPGIAGVQVATARGLRVTTDEYGRFHVTCAVIANELRGSNFIMKVDDRSLPSGYRITTENPRVERATRGKMLKFNFGATIHRVVRLDLVDGVFEPGSTELRPQWASRIDMLLEELQKAPSILRLSYLADNETESTVDDRLERINDIVSNRWQQLYCCYKLTIEKEVFWRKGRPSSELRFD